MAFEYWLQVRSVNRTDDAQNFRGRGLLLQQSGEVVVRWQQFVSSPFLDRDDGLIGEVTEPVRSACR